MRSYNNLYEPMLQDDYIKQCFINASKKKKNRNDVREVLENLDEHTELLKKMLTEELFIPDYHKPSIINESSSKKTRRILKPHYKYEQVIHHCAIGQFKPIVMNGLYEFSCGSIPGRGVHYIEYIKPKINVKKLKRIVSKHSRKENEQHDRLEKGDRNTAGTSGGNRQDIVSVNGLSA